MMKTITPTIKTRLLEPSSWPKYKLRPNLMKIIPVKTVLKTTILAVRFAQRA
jgi:hypothetical protein